MKIFGTLFLAVALLPTTSMAVTYSKPSYSSSYSTPTYTYSTPTYTQPDEPNPLVTWWNSAGPAAQLGFLGALAAALIASRNRRPPSA